jgi:SAM-dependent methyltransferase
MQKMAMSVGTSQTIWPKHIPPLTPEQKVISDDFMKYWHEVLPRRYGLIDRFNHNYSVRRSGDSFRSTLEIGAGLGEHLHYERLTQEQRRNYVAVDIRGNMLDVLAERFPRVTTVCADCQTKLPFEDGHFDRVLAIHVLEHLPNLPGAIREAHRLLNKETGRLYTVLPCEGGLAYSLARRISAQRIFERRYKQSYKWFIEREHINRPHEILSVLRSCFTVESATYFPLSVPVVTLNLCIGLVCRPFVTRAEGAC